MATLSRFPIRSLARGAVLAAGLSVPCWAWAQAKIDIGKSEYESSCAVCHGLAGRGDGPIKSQLAQPVPDLTVLAAKNGGVFPFDRVYQIIDGRQEIKTHGPREMPVWGRTFRMQSSPYYDIDPARESESGARSRILALTEYLYRLQGR